MFKVADRWMIRQLLFASLIATVVMSGPVIAISVVMHLPERALYSHLLWPSLASIVPMILYHVMPVLVAIAIIWFYGRLYMDGTLITLHLAGRSDLSVRRPGLIVAVFVAALGYLMSMVVAPWTAGNLHDVLFSIRHNLSPVLLRANVFNELDRNGDVIYFKRRLGYGKFADVFVVKNEESGKKGAYKAREAVFKREGQRNFVVLLDGSMQVRSADSTRLDVVDFDTLSLPLTPPGGAARGYRTVDELSTPRFLADRQAAFQDTVQKRSWVREAVSRFGVPGMILPHVLLGLGLLGVCGMMTERKRGPVAAICASIAFIHFAAAVLIEQIGINANWAWAFIAVVAAETLVAISLMATRTRWVAYSSESSEGRSPQHVANL
jgi:lipopolysaccharide export LptBFGC system permease protein LptF